MQQVGHDAVTTADHVRNGAHTILDQVLSVAVPNVGAVGKAGNLGQVAEVLRLCFDEHLPHEGGAQLRDTEGAGLAIDLLRGNAQCLSGYQQADHLGIVHGHLFHGDTGHVLQILVHGGHIVAQLVQLQQRIVKIFKFEVSGKHTLFLIVGGVLDGAEILNFVHIRHNHHATRVLAGGSLHAGAPLGEPVLLRPVHDAAPLFQIFFHITVGGFILQAGHSTRLEHKLLAEQLLGIPMHIALVLAGEVQVDIRLLVAVEAQEGLEGDVVTVHDQGCAAAGAVFIRQVKTIGHAAVGDEFAVLAVWAQIMGRQAVYLGDAREMSHRRGADRTTAAHLIAILV